MHAFDPGSFDAVISRFGTMFFEDPEAAFANLARAIRPVARTVHRTIKQNLFWAACS
jgi:ubiquinone/menaquinone biosynthesis C-methylase UbiE